MSMSSRGTPQADDDDDITRVIFFKQRLTWCDDYIDDGIHLCQLNFDFKYRRSKLLRLV